MNASVVDTLAQKALLQSYISDSGAFLYSRQLYSKQPIALNVLNVKFYNLQIWLCVLIWLCRKV